MAKQNIVGRLLGVGGGGVAKGGIHGLRPKYKGGGILGIQKQEGIKGVREKQELRVARARERLQQRSFKREQARILAQERGVQLHAARIRQANPTMPQDEVTARAHAAYQTQLNVQKIAALKREERLQRARQLARERTGMTGRYSGSP